MSALRLALPGPEPEAFIGVRLGHAWFHVGYAGTRPPVVRRVTADGVPQGWWRIETLAPETPYALAARAPEAFLARQRLPAVAA